MVTFESIIFFVSIKSVSLCQILVMTFWKFSIESPHGGFAALPK